MNSHSLELEQVCIDSYAVDKFLTEASILLVTITLTNFISKRSLKLGFWGFQDPGFIAKIDDRGKHYVTMKGTRYALCGKRMTRLLPFIESSLNVKIDLSKEFTTIHPRWSIDVESDLIDTDRRLLVELVNGQLSFSTLDRLRHGTGHSQEDILPLNLKMKISITCMSILISNILVNCLI